MHIGQGDLNFMVSLRTHIHIRSVISVNFTIINKYILHVLSIELRGKLYFSFSIPTPGFPHFYYVLGAKLGLLLYEEVSVMWANSFV